MKNELTSRRGFVAMGSGTILGSLFLPVSCLGKSAGLDEKVHETYPQTRSDQAKAIVGASHARIDVVKSLLESDPTLAKSSWDWGFGDWETAIGAASHMGRRDIIELLMEHGARPTLFTFAALDRVESVRAVCEEVPGIHRTHGPHGITLYKHAVHGGAKKVIDYLETLGGANEGLASKTLSDAEAKVYLGTYQFGPRDRDRFNIKKGKTMPGIGIEREGSLIRYMAMVKPHEFNLFGAESVTVVFDVENKRATTLTIRQGSFRLVATRI